jgi:catechol 2,3-dioxygenase-like lactoylglutathione lyase family enzyme
VEQRISLITLGVAEVSRSCSFYERLGWATPCEEGADVAFFPAGGLVFAVWDRSKLAADAGRTAAGAPGAMTLAHNVRSPAEVDAVLVEAEAAGATITQPARDTFWGGYAGCFADPDGHLWEVAHNPHWSLEDDGSVRLPE